MVGELLKNMLDEEGDYKPVDGPEIGSLILIDRGEYQTAEFDCFVLSSLYMIGKKKRKKEIRMSCGSKPQFGSALFTVYV